VTALPADAELHHVGIVVPAIADALPLYRDLLGLAQEDVRDLPDQAVRVVYLSGGGARVELLEPLDDASGVARFLAQRGKATLHHVCFAVDDLASALHELAARGVELIDRQPRPGAEGMVAFLHPQSGDGVLIELIDRASLREGRADRDTERP
jgi:methylmalonyl-CoA/ethylmalonyl-CoA epimerase